MTTDTAQAETTLEAALEYQLRGWVVTAVHPGQKAPVEPGWQSAPPPSDEQLHEWFDSDQNNIGVRLGDVSGGLVDFDFDDDELAAIAEDLDSEWFGQAPRWSSSGLRFHALVQTSPMPAYRSFRLDGKTVLEIRANGRQSLVPPSRHPSGATYEWQTAQRTAPTVALNDILNFGEDVVAAFALSKAWQRGLRHQVALAFGGFAARSGLTEDRAIGIVRAAARGAGDSDPNDRVAAVLDSYQKNKAGGRISGFSTLRTLVPECVSTCLADIWPTSATAAGEEWAGPFVARNGSMFIRKAMRNGPPVDIQLANFDARIIEQVIRDDGSGTTSRLFKIGGVDASGRQLPRTFVVSQDFASMAWPITEFGAGAVIASGAGTKDRLREGIQLLSGNVLTRHVYTHTGWHEIDDQLVFLHAGGALGSQSCETNLEGALKRYCLPDPPKHAQENVDASLSLLDISSSPATTALWCAMYLAPLASLTSPDLMLWIWGPTGSFKSTTAALFLSHFGQFGRTTLPEDWSSTANALEERAFLAKDVPLVVDEFAPAATTAGQRELKEKASRLVRAQGNLSGRGRMRADTTLRPARPPRGLIISTAEMPPPLGPSALARTLVTEFTLGHMNTERLSNAQKDSGLLSGAMSAYIDFVRSNYRQLESELPEVVERAREGFLIGGHPRTPEALAQLEVAGITALRCFSELSLISEEQFGALRDRIHRDLVLLGTLQAATIRPTRPGLLFIETIREQLDLGRVYLVGRAGSVPPEPEECGWTSSGPNPYQPNEHAKRIGWADDEYVYLSPQESQSVVERCLRNTDQQLGASNISLHRDLDDLGLLSCSRPSTDGVRRTAVVLLEGRQRRVLKLHRHAFRVDAED